LSRVLIVNADDFGRSPQITAGILRAHAEGIVTSTSAMVRRPAAEPALRTVAEHPGLSVGLHLDFGEWALRNGDWIATDDVVALDDEAAVEREAYSQLERFRQLAGRSPTHVDSHQHVHREGVPHRVAARLAAELGVPLRGHDQRIRFCGSFYGRGYDGSPFPQGIAVDTLVRIIRELPTGLTELGCHPGEAGVDDPLYGPERAEELRVLCDARVGEAILASGVTLVSFGAEALAP
jgi:predicted glycoside hydrolase/deacetylase ChbG (UPF0249 family)